jgi:ADP-ribosylglycohydrolase
MKNLKIFKNIKENSFEERAFGCIVGAFVGDACGSMNEFTTQLRGESFMD